MRLEYFSDNFVSVTQNFEPLFQGLDLGHFPGLDEIFRNDKSQGDKTFNAKHEQGPSLTCPNHDRNFVKHVMNM